MCGLRPLLTLSTKDGAFLANTDEISQVLSSNEEVRMYLFLPAIEVAECEIYLCSISCDDSFQFITYM